MPYEDVTREYKKSHPKSTASGVHEVTRPSDAKTNALKRRKDEYKNLKPYTKAMARKDNPDHYANEQYAKAVSKTHKLLD